MLIYAKCQILSIMMKNIATNKKNTALKKTRYKAGFFLFQLTLQQIRSDDRIGLSLRI